MFFKNNNEKKLKKHLQKNKYKIVSSEGKNVHYEKEFVKTIYDYIGMSKSVYYTIHVFINKSDESDTSGFVTNRTLDSRLEYVYDIYAGKYSQMAIDFVEKHDKKLLKLIKRWH